MTTGKKSASRLAKITRRTFLLSTGLVGGGLALGLTLAPNRLKMSSAEAVSGSEILLNTWVKITPDNQVTVIIPHSEMGQGAGTGLAQMLVEELEADWDFVSIEQAPATGPYTNSDLARGYIVGEGAAIPEFMYRLLDFTFLQLAKNLVGQITGGSTAIRLTGQHGMRRARAAAKEMILRAAARQWDVDLSALRVEKSVVYHSASQRSASFGELASAAASFKPSLKPQLKEPKDYSIVGQPKPRLDIPPKVDGTAVFGIDVVVPNMLNAAIMHAPVFGAKVASIDESVLTGQTGIKRIINLGNAVAVVAETYWEASTALAKLAIQWQGGLQRLSSQTVRETHENDLATKDRDSMDSQGDAETVLSSDQAISAEYSVPYLAHATMEPMNCTAWVRDDKCDLWVGHQNPIFARNEAARVLDIDTDNVTVHHCLLGGGFGRRAQLDFVNQAVRIARELNKPIKLTWSREQDMANDNYRPAVIGQMKGLVDHGRIQAISHAYIDALSGMPDSERPFEVQYDVPNQNIERIKCPSPIPVGTWRSVDFTQLGFFNESFIDELAYQAASDPLEFRLAHTSDSRTRTVLERLGSETNWSSSMTTGRAQGVAIVHSFETIVAQVVDLSVDEKQQIKVHQVTSVVDCGQLINPNAGEAQIQGSVIYGLTAALFGEITLSNGQVEQQNFPNYNMLKLANTPRQSVHFITSNEPPGGLGEPGVPPVAPALTNALFKATGTRVRELPITRSGFSVI